MSDARSPTDAPWLEQQAYNFDRQRWLESCVIGEQAVLDLRLIDAQRERVYTMLCEAALALLPCTYAVEVLGRCLAPLRASAPYAQLVERLVSACSPALIRCVLPVLAFTEEQFSNLNGQAFERRQFDLAEAICDVWCQAYPDSESARGSIPWVYWRQLRYEKALACFEENFARQSDPGTLEGIAIVLNFMGRYEQSVEAYERLTRLEPAIGQRARTYSCSLFGMDRIKESMTVFEGRLNDAMFWAKAPRDIPVWNGEPLEGRLLVLTDVGWSWGDHLQYLRYVQALKQSHPNLRLEVDSVLAPVLRAVWPDLEIHTTVKTEGCEAYVWLMSLPVVLGRFDTASEQLPWLKAPVERQTRWADWFDAQAASSVDIPRRRPRIGVCWKGNPNTYHDKFRSLQFSDLNPLFDSVQNVDWVNLQLEGRQSPPAAQMAAAGSRWLDPMGLVKDFMDTVAIASQLDEVMTVDTATAHACGSAGIKMSLFTPSWGEWRWQHEAAGEHSVWYPSATLIRTPGHSTLSQTLSQLANSGYLERRLHGFNAHSSPN